MNVLIVEDDQNKLRQLVDFIKSVYPNWRISERRSYQSGLKAVLDNVYDVLILDMSMPTYDISPIEPGGRPRHFAGREIMSQMSRKNVDTPTIIVTQFETFGEGEEKTSLTELKKLLEASGDNKYRGTIYYSAGRDTWKKELFDSLRVIADKESGATK